MTGNGQATGGTITVDEALDIARRLADLGRVGEAESQLKAILNVAPDHHDSLALLVEILESRGDADGAIEIYDRLARLVPGRGWYFSRPRVLRLRQTWGTPPPPSHRDTTRPAISMRSLGTLGRFGNQLLQYSFLRMVAAAHGAEAVVPDWIGRDLFDLDDPFPEERLPRLAESETAIEAALDPGSGFVAAGRDLYGYYNLETRLFAPHRDLVRGLFRPGAHIRDRIEKAFGALSNRGGDIVAIHLRRGDFGQGKFWIAPEDWYLNWLDEIWPALDNPVLYVASDEPDIVQRFSAYNAVSAQDFGPAEYGIEYIEDFFMLTLADALATSNSTFSGMAALLNERARHFVRPDPAGDTLIPFDPWNTVIFQNRVE